MGTSRSIELPQGLTAERHLRLEGRNGALWARRALLGLLVLLLAVALANVFGQRPTTSRTASSAAVLSVVAPTAARGGLLYTARFSVAARRDVKSAELILDPGWIDGMQVNSTNPQPEAESSADGRLVLRLGPIRRGHSVVYFIEFQVDPTTLGRRREDVTLADGSRVLLAVHRSLTVFP